MKKPILYSPLMGSAITTIVFLIYASISGLLKNDLNDQPLSITNIIMGLAFTLPLLFILFSIFAYFFALTFGFVLVKIKNKLLLKEGTFWFLALILGSIVGSGIALLNYHIEHIETKSYLIIFCFAFGSLFSASLYSVLTGKTKAPKIKLYK